MKNLRAAVIGVGYLGRFHAQKYAALEGVDLIGVVDSDREHAESVAAEVGTQAYSDYRELFGQVDLVSVAVPTSLHHAVALELLNAGIHVLLEKPMAPTVAECEEIIAAAEKTGATLQIGHLERFNPAMLRIKDRIVKPMFIEAHRISPFKARGADVDVVLDVMIHDIDIILALVKAPIESVEAVGVPVLTSGVDITNARLRFDSGCIANITASRISADVMRKIRIFQPDSYISIDCAKNTVECYTLDKDKQIGHEHFEMNEADALQAEIAAFVECVRSGLRPEADGHAGMEAVKVAHLIKGQMILPEL